MSQQGNQSLEHGRVTRQFEDVDHELARLAYLCDVDLSNEDNVRGVIADNLPSAAARNPPAFKRMRDLLMLHYVLRERAVESIGAAETPRQPQRPLRPCAARGCRSSQPRCHTRSTRIRFR